MNNCVKWIKVIYLILAILFTGYLMVLFSILGKNQLSIDFIFNLFSDSYLSFYILINCIVSILLLILASTLSMNVMIIRVFFMLILLLIIFDIILIVNFILTFSMQDDFIYFLPPILILSLHILTMFLLLRKKGEI